MRILNQLLYVLPIWWLIPIAVIGQSHRIDSLQNLIASLPPEGTSFATDTARVLLLCELGRGKDKNGLFTGNYKLCLNWLKKAETISQKIKWNKGLFYSNMYAGAWHSWQGNHLNGLQKMRKAAYYAELEKSPIFLSNIYRFLGDTYDLMKNYDLAIAYFKKSLRFKNKDNIRTYLISSQNLGSAYYRKGLFDSAGYWFEKSYNLCKTYHSTQLLKYVLLNWAEVCIAIRNDKKLDKLLAEYTTVLFEDPAWDVHFFTLNAQRYLFLQRPQRALQELKKVRENLSKASNRHQQQFYEQLSNTHKLLGNPLEALICYKQFISLREQDERELQQRQVEYIKFEYENLKQQDAIKLLNQDILEQKRTRNTLIAGVILALLLAAFYLWNNRVLNKKNVQIENQKQELEILKDQLSQSNQQLTRFNNDLETKVSERTQALTKANEELIRKNHEIQEAFWSGTTQERKRVASELHDNLGSTVSGLIWQLESIKPENLTELEQEIYDGLIQQMQNAYFDIRHISHHLLPLELEKGLGNALKRLTSDLNHAGKTTFVLKGKIPNDSLTKPQQTELYSICLEIINNTLKHAKATQCTIQFEQKGNELTIQIQDNGQGFDLQDLGRRGRGLANIEERIRTLNGTLQITSQPAKGSQFLINVLIEHPTHL